MTDQVAPQINALVQQALKDNKLLPEAAANLSAWLKESWLPAWAKAAMEELIEAGNWPELNDRFYKLNEFGTAGIRGRTIAKASPKAELGQVDSLGAPQYANVGSAVLNDFNILRATVGLYNYAARYLAANSQTFEAPKLVIAHDVRHFSRHFAELTASAWTQLGGRALLFDGPRSTPQLSFTVRHTGAVAGVVITASHNPAHDNGYKVYFADGSQIVTPHDSGIINEVNATPLEAIKPLLNKNLAGVVNLPKSVDEAYIKALEGTLVDPAVLKAHPPQMVYSNVHGTGAVAVVPALTQYSRAPLTVPEQLAFDGRFPTVKSPNPQNAEALSMAMKLAEQKGIDVVLATDPDCDRMGAAVRGKDGQWLVLTGNTIGSLLAEDRLNAFKAKGLLPAAGHPNATLIKTFVTTPLQDAIAAAHGIQCVNTHTGFKWIGNKLALYENRLQAALAKEGTNVTYDALPDATRRQLLLKHSKFYVFGGEESYGYLASDKVRDKDGNAAVLMFAELLARLAAQGRTLSDALEALYLKYGYYAETPMNVTFEGATGAVKLQKLVDSYVKNPPKTIGDFVVRSIRDFNREVIQDADGDTVPKAAVMIFELDDGTSFAVRRSGTEPNVRYYCFTREAVREPADLLAAQQRAADRLVALKAALTADSTARSA